jgi:serine/threonine protein phosphatase PrpC
VKAALLRGRDHTATGAIAEVAEGPVGAAMSRGGAPKPYPHTDPNEDAALCARGAHGLLVAVADGHWGRLAAELALEHLLAAHAEDWTDGAARAAARWYQELLAALCEANDAVLAAHAPQQRSRTTLALALARPEQQLLACASAGDSHVFQVAGDEPSEVVANRARRPLFLGEERLAASRLEREVRIEVRPLGECSALVLATDGLSEEEIGVADPLAAVRSALAQGRAQAADLRAAAMARALVEAAVGAHRANQAGDNVAVAVAWLGR